MTVMPAGYMTGKLVAAMPFVHSSHLSQIVIYVCGHDSQGAIGLMLNRIFPTMTFQEMLEQLGAPASDDCRQLVLHYGGSIEMTRGFVLHSTDVQMESTVMVAPHFALTSTMDILRELAEGRGPRQAFVSLGYTAWSPGQLEDEILRNLWVVIDDPAPELVFQPHVDHSWHQSLAHLGINPHMLSLEAGNA
jgi:putative transcriptional regulator